MNRLATGVLALALTGALGCTSTGVPAPTAKTCSKNEDCGAKQFCLDTACVQDDVPPTVEVSLPALDQVLTTETARLEGSASDADGSGVTSAEYALDDGAFQPLTLEDGKFALSFPTVVEDKKEHQLKVRATDSAANVSEVVVRRFAVDRVGPTVTLTAPEKSQFDATTVGQTIEFSASVKDLGGVAAFEWSSDKGETWNAATGDTVKHTIPVTADLEGMEYSFQARATDSHGNATPAASVGPVFVDAKAPTLTVTSPTDDQLFTTETLTVTGTAEDAALDHIEVTIDGAPVELTVEGSSFSGSVPLPTTDLASRTVVVKAFDKAGNASEPVTRTVRVDRVGPVLKIVSPVADSMVNLAHTLPLNLQGSVTDAAGATVSFQYDGGPEVQLTIGADGSFSAPLAVLDEDDTPHQVSLVATDGSGHSTTQTVSFRVDRKAPVITILSPAADSVHGGAATSVTITGTVADANPGTATFHTDTAPAETPLPLAGGTFEQQLALPATDDFVKHTVTITATDAAGNPAQPVSLSYRVDRVAPTLSVRWPVEGSTISLAKAPPFNLEGDVADPGGIGAVKYHLDSETDKPITNLGTGSFTAALALLDEDYTAHQVTVSATDAIGNSTSKVVSFFVDRRAPSIAFKTPAADSVHGGATTSVTVTGTVLDNNLDGATYTTDSVTTPAALTVTGDAFSKSLPLSATDDYVKRTMTVTASDKAGNKSAPVSLSYYVDRVAPRVTITSPAADVTCSATACAPALGIANVASPNLTLQVDVQDGSQAVANAVTLAPTVDGSAASGLSCGVTADKTKWTCTWTGTNPADNNVAHTLGIKATDLASNFSSKSRVVRVDRVAPAVTMLASGRGFQRSQPLFRFSEDMDVASVVSAAKIAPLTTPTFAVRQVAGSRNFEATMLAPYTEYTLTVEGHAKDLCGNTSAVGTSTFLTETVAPTSGPINSTSYTGARVAVDADGNPLVAVLDATGKLEVHAWNGSAWVLRGAAATIGNGSLVPVLHGVVAYGTPSGTAPLKPNVTALVSTYLASSSLSSLYAPMLSSADSWTSLAAIATESNPLLRTPTLRRNVWDQFQSPPKPPIHRDELEVSYLARSPYRVMSTTRNTAGSSWTSPASMYSYPPAVDYPTVGGSGTTWYTTTCPPSVPCRCSLHVADWKLAAELPLQECNTSTVDSVSGLADSDNIGLDAKHWLLFSTGEAATTRLACRTFDDTVWKLSGASAVATTSFLDMTENQLAGQFADGVRFANWTQTDCSDAPPAPAWEPVIAGATQPSIASGPAGERWRAYLSASKVHIQAP